MKNLKWIPVLAAALFASPIFAQPLVMDDDASADIKAQIYENESQVAETSGASSAMQTDNGAPAAGDAHATDPVQDVANDAGKADPAVSAKTPDAEPKAAASEHASASTGHPEKPVAKPERKRVHVVKHAKKKTG